MRIRRLRKTVRGQVQLLVVQSTLIALVTLAIAAIFGMVRLRDNGEKILTEQMTRNLLAIIEDKSELAQSGIRLYEEQVGFLSACVADLYEHPENHVGKEVRPPLHTTPQGAFSLSRAFADAGIDPKDPQIRKELEQLGALEYVFAPLTKKSDGMVSTVYFGTESGILVSYDTYAYEASTADDADMVFDYFAREWYRKGNGETGVFWTGVYADEFGRGLNITCASPVYTGRGDFCGVVAEDILITDLYESMVRLTLGEGAYVLLLDEKGEPIDPDPENEDNAGTSLSEEERAQVLSGGSGLFLSEDGVYHAYAPIKGLGWTLMIQVPQSLIYAPVKTMNRTILRTLLSFLAIAVVALLILIGLSGKWARKLTGPTMELMHDVERMRDGDLEHRATVHLNDEVGELAGCFNEMAETIQHYIENVKVMTAEQEKARTELEIAAGIQADILPTDTPAFPGHEEFDIFAKASPAKGVSGDFYDYFLIDDDHLALVIADVSGKGVPAALFMVVTKTLLKTRAMMGGSPGEILKDVNEQLCGENKAEIFVTVWLGILTISSGELVDANAGHEYPVFRQDGGKYEFHRAEHNPPLATLPGLEFSDHRMQLKDRDAIFLYTDGVTEAKNPGGVRFGLNRITEILNRDPDAAPGELVERLHGELKAYEGDEKPYDDATMLSFVYHGTEPGGEK